MRPQLGRFSMGVGDRFAQQAEAQLRAFLQAAEHGLELTPVWNKSNREHVIVGSEPASVRAAAHRAVEKLHWTRPWFVDADHVRLETVDRFIPHADFFTIDVAEVIGKPASRSAASRFVERHPELIGSIEIDGIDARYDLTPVEVERIAVQYLEAVQEAARVYQRIADARAGAGFITEISMDETLTPQTPAELLIILAALADEGVPVATIAPRFNGQFNKGVDYVGDLTTFAREFNDDLCVVAHAVKRYALPRELKLSIHSGSDKFSLYPVMQQAMSRHRAGVHLKTAGTTWLEELIGLSEGGGEALSLAKEIYREAVERIDELCAPYATVIEIDQTKLPGASILREWTSEQFVRALRHDPQCPEFNPHLRQLLHVAYKIAAMKGERFRHLVQGCRPLIARNVTANLFQRHIQPLFLGLAEPIS